MTETKTLPQPDAKQSPLASVARGLEMRREQFRAMLPSHIPAERFERVVMTAVNIDPDLLTADRRSFYNACMRAASDGLLPDKREGALVTFNDKQAKQKLVAWMPMVFGLIKKIRQSGEIDSIGARIVYQREIDEYSPSQPLRKRFEFIIEDGQEKLFHDPMLWGERGEKVLVYAYARFKDGYVQYQPVHKSDVLKRRAVARTDKVWSSWEDEMWLKTAIRAIAGRLPLSADVMSTIERDEAPSEFDKLRNAAVAALGAPLEEASATDVSDGEDRRKELRAEEFIRNAMRGLADPGFTTVDELEDYAQRIRVGLDDMNPPEGEKKQLLEAFQNAFIDRANAMAPEQRA
jgi:recombination protein RecT